MQEERLIELVKQHKFLYDKKHKHFKKHQNSKRTWDQIGTTLNVSGVVAKNRWRTLKDRYIRIMKHRNTKCIKYKYAKMLSFLDDDASSNEYFTDETSMSLDNYPHVYDDMSVSSLKIKNSSSITVKPLHISPEEKKSPITDEFIDNANTNNDLVIHLLKSLNDASKTVSKERGFCDSLALQLEEAKMPSHNFRNFQIKVIQLLNDEIANVKMQKTNCELPNDK